ncbi:MAG TPA: hypothetical protein VFX92_11230 [Candidatus Krumholzibacteria bacterium]|nr:hypothetical protein [Candidatus Krumholzibacteria bacterium]
MSQLRSRIRAAAFVAVALGSLTGSTVRAAAPDSLLLQTPGDTQVRSVYNKSEKRFVVWLSWREAGDSVAAFISPPDTAGWAVTTPSPQLSVPATGGVYTGDIDRTVILRATRQATLSVGVDSILISCEVRREEYINGTITLTPSYVPGTFVPVIFRDSSNNGAPVDFGLQVSFGPGKIDFQGSFTVALEDFEGFHIWRGIEPDGSDLTIIGEVSKEEAFKGRSTGGSLEDSVYFYDVLPTLRQQMTWFSIYGGVDCLGTRIDFPLDDDQFFWWDCDASNGFTYYYTVTAFDRGYNAGSSSQGLVKFDNCTVSQGVPYPCRDQLVPLTVEVDPQSDLYRVYAVPNPFRSGSSRLTSDNYHNYPDDFIRFVNVPPSCTLKIFTVAGDLVWETTHNAPRGNIEWDVTNRNSDPVTSGVYVYRLETPEGESVYGRIVVIR